MTDTLFPSDSSDTGTGDAGVEGGIADTVAGSVSDTVAEAAAVPAAAAPTTASPTTAAPSAASPDATGRQPARPRPRIRSGAIVWGLLVSATAVLILTVVGSPTNGAAFSAWAGALGAGGVILTAVIALGAFILLMALLSLIRREQRKRA
ncbi:hypothetical protein [Rathayibacter soli]|uniref:hypothetical protein n=1 Tax=Rathayibacter soli TaxID=3144168 RepID=UPI0027E4A655|nr:hypothetical protein [Glaciibacter superstes]